MKKWTIREFAAHVGIEIKGRLVRVPEYEYDGKTRFYSDDRGEKDDLLIGFWISDGRVKIFCSETNTHYDSNDY